MKVIYTLVSFKWGQGVEISTVDGNIGFCDEEGIGELSNFDNKLSVSSESLVEHSIEDIGRLDFKEGDSRGLVQINRVGGIFFGFISIQIGAG